MDSNKEFKKIEDDCNFQLEDFEKFKDIDDTDFCPNCDFEPDSDDTMISCGPKKHCHSLSVDCDKCFRWIEIHKCPECGTIFKVTVDSC